MIKQIDHIGIAVNNMGEGVQLFNAILDSIPFHKEEIVSQKLIATFYEIGNTKIELLEPTSTDSAISKFLLNKGPGIHHVAFLVDNIHSEMQRMKSEGFKALSEEPYIGALGKLVCFFHPKTTGGSLIELCQKK
ncbi:MAG: methylmalonyl-CoA epimerase [Chitinophagales bacterium]|nr:methylmalonyl-CoA epimerase [Chitinophagales bacterium]MCZ2392687.1 methylmalonyl-CoA epimerase [Chitinophagales bacterium]